MLLVDSEVLNRLEALSTDRRDKFTHAQLLKTRHFKLCRKDRFCLSVQNVIVISLSLLGCLVSIYISQCSSPDITRKQVQTLV